MKLLDDYFALQSQIHEYFGYTEQWRVIPLNDCRRMYWHLIGKEKVGFAFTEAELASQSGQYYSNLIFSYVHLPKFVYRGPEYTMICCDTQTDGNVCLSVFDNAKERPAPEG